MYIIVWVAVLGILWWEIEVNAVCHSATDRCHLWLGDIELTYNDVI